MTANAIQAQVIRSQATDQRVPFKDGFFFGSLLDVAGLRLAGSRCKECGVALWGVRHRCENCSSTQISEEAFDAHGTVHTFTVQRYAPPKPNRLPEAWAPRAVAWVDLDHQGPRVLAILTCAADQARIGMRVRLKCEVGFLDEHGREVVTYAFEPEQQV